MSVSPRSVPERQWQHPTVEQAWACLECQRRHCHFSCVECVRAEDFLDILAEVTMNEILHQNQPEAAAWPCPAGPINGQRHVPPEVAGSHAGLGPSA